MELTVKEAQVRAIKLKNEIVDLINQFERETLLSVDFMDLGDRTLEGRLTSIRVEISVMSFRGL